jgi:hypothetical protein
VWRVPFGCAQGRLFGYAQGRLFDYVSRDETARDFAQDDGIFVAVRAGIDLVAGVGGASRGNSNASQE